MKQEFETEEAMDEAFEDFEEKMREEVRLKDLICAARERLALANDEQREAEYEIRALEQQLEELNI